MILPWLKWFCREEKDFAVTVVGNRNDVIRTCIYTSCTVVFRFFVITVIDVRLRRRLNYAWFAKRNRNSMVVYHLQQLSGNSGWKVNGTRRFGSFQWRISGSNRTSEKVVLFFRTECPKRKLVYHLFKPNLWYQFQALAAIFCPNNNQLGSLTWRKTSLLKWLHNLWNFLAIIPTRLTSLMQSNYAGAEFLRTAYQFRKNLFRKLIRK